MLYTDTTTNLNSHLTSTPPFYTGEKRRGGNTEREGGELVLALAEGGFRIFRGRKRGKKEEASNNVKEGKWMEWWGNMIFTFRKLWFPLSSRLHSRKTGAGLLKLHDDVQACEYQDVQVMWEMLSRTESEMITINPKRKQRPFWKILVWSNRRGRNTRAASLSEDHV